MFVEILV